MPTENHVSFPNRRRSERTLMAFTECCNVLVNSSSEPELLENICRIICETGGYRMAWVGYAEDGESKSVRPLAHSGFEDGYLADANITWDDAERGKGPTGTAIRKNEIVLNRDFASNEMLRPWKEEALKRGYLSSIAVPLAIDGCGRPIGALTIYSSQIDAFDHFEVELLKSLATFLSHGIISMRRNSAKLVSERALLESEERFRNLIEYAIIGRFISEKEKISYVNPKFALIFGYDRAEILKYDLFHLLSEDRSNLELLFTGLVDGDIEGFHIETKGVKKDGVLIDIELEMSTMQYRKSRVFTGTVIDITQRKRAETELKRSREEYRMLSARIQSLMEEERARISREIHDELGQALTAMKMDLRRVKEIIFGNDRDPDLLKILKRMQDISEMINEAIKVGRRIAYDLRPSILDDLGIIEAIRFHLQEFHARAGIYCCFSSDRDHINVDKQRATAIFRIFQEALTNAARHSGAEKILVTINGTDRNIRLEIKDNGIGIRECRVGCACLGILGMKERALQFGGKVEIFGKKGKGTSVTLIMPVDVEDAACHI